MTVSGSVELANCGTYSYNITGSDLPAPPQTPVEPPVEPPSAPPPSLRDQWGYDKDSIGQHEDISGRFQASAAGQACKDADKHIIKSGDSSTNIYYLPSNFVGNTPYVCDVYWEPNCKSKVTEMSAGKPLPDQPDVTCESLLKGNYEHCELHNLVT
jgi:hypothetical protein